MDVMILDVTYDVLGDIGVRLSGAGDDRRQLRFPLGCVDGRRRRTGDATADTGGAAER